MHLNQTLGEQWTGSGGPVDWPAPSPGLNLLDFWFWVYTRTSMYSARDQSNYYSNQSRLPVRRFEWNQECQTECAPLWDEQLKVVLKCVVITQTICCGDYMNINHSSVWICFLDIRILWMENSVNLSKYGFDTRWGDFLNLPNPSGRTSRRWEVRYTARPP
jgi:hypothetical protein